MYLLINGFGEASTKIRRTKVEPQLKDGDKVADLRARVAGLLNKPTDAFILIHSGVVLRDDDQLLSSVKIRPASSSVQVFPKPPKAPTTTDEPANPVKMSDEDIQQFMIALGMAVRNPSFRKVVQRMKHREGLENVVAICPDLANDPIGCAFLGKPELLISLLDPETLKYVAERHPGLVEAVRNLAAAVHEEKPTSAAQNNPAEAANPFAFHLDEMSDDEDDEMEGGAAAGPSAPHPNRGRPIITPDQLAAALVSAQQGSLFGGITGMLGHNQPRQSTPGSASGGPPPRFPSSSASPASAPRPPPFFSRPPSTPSTGGITPELLNAALAAAQQQFPSQRQPQQQQPQQQQQPTDNYESSLATMREMGIIDEGLARRALQVMGGDLQAAIDLIFTGWLGEDE